MRRHFPNIQIVWKLGNHEARYQRLILDRVAVLADLEEFEYGTIMKAHRYGIEMVAADRPWTFCDDKLWGLHGHEYGSGFWNPVNQARGMWLRTKGVSTVSGHGHKPSEHFEQRQDLTLVGEWSTGCLCDKDPEYRRQWFNGWIQGFAWAYKTGVKNFRLDNYKIIDGIVI